MEETEIEEPKIASKNESKILPIFVKDLDEHDISNNNTDVSKVELKESSTKVLESSPDAVVGRKCVKNSETQTESICFDHPEECRGRQPGETLVRSTENYVVKDEEPENSLMETDTSSDDSSPDFNEQECQIKVEQIEVDQENFTEAGQDSAELNMSDKDGLSRHQDVEMNLDEDDEDESSDDDAEIFELVKRELELRRQKVVVPQERDCWVNPHLLQFVIDD